MRPTLPDITTYALSVFKVTHQLKHLLLPHGAGLYAAMATKIVTDIKLWFSFTSPVR